MKIIGRKTTTSLRVFSRKISALSQVITIAKTAKYVATDANVYAANVSVDRSVIPKIIRPSSKIFSMRSNHSGGAYIILG